MQILLIHLNHHDVKELLKVNPLSIILFLSFTKFFNEFDNLFLWRVKSECSQYYFKILCFYCSWTCYIEEIESFLDFILLCLIQHLIIVHHLFLLNSIRTRNTWFRHIFAIYLSLYFNYSNSFNFNYYSHLHNADPSINLNFTFILLSKWTNSIL